MSDEDIELPPLPKASKMYDIPGYDEEELKDYARTAIQADRTLRAARGVVDGCHCATCTCNPGMTPAIRFDTSPAAQEGAVRDHLIALGWTPPGAQHPAITHCDNCGCDWLDNGLNPIGCPYCKQLEYEHSTST